jgi:hypothetical protein
VVDPVDTILRVLAALKGVYWNVRHHVDFVVAVFTWLAVSGSPELRRIS